MDRANIEQLLYLPLPDLMSLANKTRAEYAGSKVELCNILNAKSGMCGEDCKFCAQSARHSTRASVYPLKSKDEIIAAASRAREMGAQRFDIVTSGNTLTKDEVALVADAVQYITTRLSMKMCASLGKLDEADFKLLKDSGLTRYHHNIETSPNYYPRIVSTHSFQDRLNTIRSAMRVGLEVCSGGIIGMGEGWADRIDMAFILKELDVTSVPLNILVPIKGTLFENVEPLSAADAIRTIAIFRIILKDKIIKVAAGRESMPKDFQAMAFMAGANGMLIGGYLTIKGRAVADDRKLVDEIERAWNA